MAELVSTESAVAEFAGQLFFRLWRVSHTRTVDASRPLELNGITGRAWRAFAKSRNRAVALSSGSSSFIGSVGWVADRATNAETAFAAVQSD